MPTQKIKSTRRKKIIFLIIIIIIIILLLLLSRCHCNETQNLTNTNTNKTNNHKIINTDLNNDLNTDTNNNSNSNTNDNQENPWPDLSGCINGLIVDYHSTAKATNETEAGEIFKEYISWAQMNNKEIFFGKGNRWQFQSAAPHGIYQGVKYWKITALWFSEIKQQWLPQIVFDVSENGQVVRLLGCL